MPREQPHFAETVTLTALLISLVALSIDSMLPALPEIGRALSAAHPNDTQLVLSALFLGLAAGQLVYGPASDSLGRRSAILAGLILYAAGAALCSLAQTFDQMLAGRFVQGLGAAGPRVVGIAMIRDRYAGNAMARVMSFVMAVFIVVPIVAPALGQLTAHLLGWRAIFAGLILLSAIAMLWFGWRQPETLPIEKRIPFRSRRIWLGVRETLALPSVVGYMAATSMVFGALVGYLACAQPILAVQYGLGASFPLYFAAFALSIGTASLTNARLVSRLGMRRLMRSALIAFSLMSGCFLAWAWVSLGQPPLWSLFAYMLAAFFCLGILFGNLNAAAMEPLGHIAGIGSAVFGCVTTLMSTLIGAVIGFAYDGTVLPLIFSFLLLGLASLAIVWAVESTAARLAQATSQPERSATID